MSAGDMVTLTYIENNVLTRIAKLEALLREMQTAGFEVERIDALTEDMGSVTQGEWRIKSDEELPLLIHSGIDLFEEFGVHARSATFDTNGIKTYVEESSGVTKNAVIWDAYTLRGDGTLVARATYPCTILAAGTVLTIGGTWSNNAQNQWHVYAVKNGTRILTATVSHAATLNTATFAPSVNTPIDGFEIELDSGAIGYNAGDVVSTGSVAATASGGTNVTVNNGNTLYCIEATGGPWNWKSIYPEDVCYNFSRGAGQSPTGGGIGYWKLVQYGTDEGFGLEIPSGCLYTEAVDDHYGRTYFYGNAVGGVFNFCVADFKFDDNVGSLDYILRLASADPSEIILQNGTLDNAAISVGDVSAATHAATSITTPADDDQIGMWRAVDNALVNLSWANLVNTLDGKYPRKWIKSASPTVDDDTDAGYANADEWVDQAGGKIYLCFDNAAGAAIWIQVAAGVGSDPVFVIDGALATASNVMAVVFVRETEISEWWISCDATGTSGATIVDLNLLGTGTIFATQANRPTLAYNDSDKVAVSGAPSTTVFPAGSIITLDIDAIAPGASRLIVAGKVVGGNGSAGFNLTVEAASGTPSVENVGVIKFNGAHITNDGNGTVSIKSAAVQMAHYETGSEAHATALIPYDDTIPQSSEGHEFLSCSITPLDANNYLVIEVNLNVSSTQWAEYIAALFRDSGTNAIAVANVPIWNTNLGTNLRILHRELAGSTAATTYKVRAGTSTSGTMTINGRGSARKFGGMYKSSITIWEIAP